MEIQKSLEDFTGMFGPLGSDSERIDGVVVGRLIGLRDSHVPLVVYAGQSDHVAVAARSAVNLRGEHIGRDVVLTFEGGDPCSPIVMGCLMPHCAWPLPDCPGQIQVDVDGERLTITSAREIVLLCGKSSITLTREGRVDIRGTYVVTRSTGVNRINGGSVQIN